MREYEVMDTRENIYLSTQCVYIIITIMIWSMSPQIQMVKF